MEIDGKLTNRRLFQDNRKDDVRSEYDRTST